MFRGRKRKLPFSFIPEPYYHDTTDSDEIPDGGDLVHSRHADIPGSRGIQSPGKRVQLSVREQVGPQGSYQHQAQQDEASGREIGQRSFSSPSSSSVGSDEHEDGTGGREIVQRSLSSHSSSSVGRDEHQDGQERGQEENLYISNSPHEDDDDDEGHDEEVPPFNQEQDDEEIPPLIPNEEEYQQNVLEDMDDDPDDDDDDPDDEEDEEDENYFSLLHCLSKKWMEAELDHTVSKVGSNLFWKIAFKFVPRILEAKAQQRVTRKTPQFNHIRRTLYDKYTPDVNLEIAYREKETDEVRIVNESVMPKSRFPPDKFEKLYEIASVKVIETILQTSFLRTLVL